MIKCFNNGFLLRVEPQASHLCPLQTENRSVMKHPQQLSYERLPSDAAGCHLTKISVAFPKPCISLPEGKLRQCPQGCSVRSRSSETSPNTEVCWYQTRYKPSVSPGFTTAWKIPREVKTQGARAWRLPLEILVKAPVLQ